MISEAQEFVAGLGIICSCRVCNVVGHGCSCLFTYVGITHFLGQGCEPSALLESWEEACVREPFSLAAALERGIC